MNEETEYLSEKFMADDARALSPIPREVVRQVIEARRERHRNRTRELERERRGDMTTRAIQRKAKGLPAHILAAMSPASRRREGITRSLSEVGYVGMTKARLGKGLRDEARWRIFEEGEVGLRPRLAQEASVIEAENQRRREASQVD
jgi:hypothetical protein